MAKHIKITHVRPNTSVQFPFDQFSEATIAQSDLLRTTYPGYNSYMTANADEQTTVVVHHVVNDDANVDAVNAMLPLWLANADDAGAVNTYLTENNITYTVETVDGNPDTTGMDDITTLPIGV